MPFRSIVAASALMTLATPSFGLEYQGSNGQADTPTENQYGTAMKSGSETIYLGLSCDALDSDGNKGTWAWANGGFIIEFPNRRIGFARQDNPVNDGGKCRM